MSRNRSVDKQYRDTVREPKSLKSKSMYSNNFIINYDDYINYYRIYFWNISRQIKDDNANKFINILTGLETASCEVYVVFKTSASITMKYSKNDILIVYKSQKFK